MQNSPKSEKLYRKKERKREQNRRSKRARVRLYYDALRDSSLRKEKKRKRQ